MTPQTDDRVRVLVVDDDPRDYELTKCILSRIYGERLLIDWMSDAGSAFGAIVRGRYDVGLIDQRMPGRDGLWVIREAFGAGCATPLVLFTGLERPGLEAEALRSGAADCLVKGRTDARALERALSHAIQRARAAEERRRRAEARAGAAEAARDRLLALVAHELRTPLAPALIAVTDLLERADSVGPDELRGALEMVRRNVELEARLVDDLLDVSRIASGKFRIEPTAVDVHRVVRQALEVCADKVARSGLDVRLELDAADPTVEADPARLLQVAWNLVANAAKFAPGGVLTVRSSNRQSGAGGRLVVDFRDDGAGIDPDARSRIFEPFEQGAGSGPAAGGLGLGLTIARAIARAHGGDLRVASPRGGRGSVFRLTLPSPRRPAGAVGGPAASKPCHGPGRLRLLVVEDNPDTRRYLALVLGRSHDVTAASCLADAREAARRGRFDLLVCDVELPDGSGLDLMRELASAQDLLGIAMSGYGAREDVERSLRAGFSRHLTKPLSAARLGRAVRDVAVGPRRGSSGSPV